MKRVAKPFDPPSLISRASILSVGLALFVIAYVWPPLILFIAFAASLFIPYSFRTTDDATTRRLLFTAFKQDESIPSSLRVIPDDIDLEERYWVNSRGMALMSWMMRPKNLETKAVVFFCHGYGDNSSFVKRREYQRFLRQGIAVAALEYEGHGRSDGYTGLIHDFNLVVKDVASFCDETSRRHYFLGDKVFLMGESLGGAVAFNVYQQRPELFAGVIFVAPMCKLADDVLPPPWVSKFFLWIVGKQGSNNMIGYLPVAPAKKNLNELSFRILEKRNLATSTPTAYGRNPRLTTARELFLATERISKEMRSFDAPFLVMHGKSDRLTDPKLSRILYDESISNDKTMKEYDGMWHSITAGEPTENIDLVFHDAIQWIFARI